MGKSIFDPGRWESCDGKISGDPNELDRIEQMSIQTAIKLSLEVRRSFPGHTHRFYIRGSTSPLPHEDLSHTDPVCLCEGGSEGKQDG